MRKKNNYNVTNWNTNTAHSYTLLELWLHSVLYVAPNLKLLSEKSSVECRHYVQIA